MSNKIRAPRYTNWLQRDRRKRARPAGLEPATLGSERSASMPCYRAIFNTRPDWVGTEIPYNSGIWKLGNLVGG